MKKVTDPAILAQLNGDIPKKVTDPEILAQLNAEETPTQIAPEQKSSLLDDGVNISGRLNRNIIEGVLALPALVADGVAGFYNTGADVYDNARSPKLDELVTGKQKGFRFGYTNDAISQALDKIGLPKARTGGERIVDDIGKVLIGVGGGGVIGPALAESRMASPIVSRIGQLMGEQLPTQAVSAVGATGAGSTIRESGGGPVAQTIASLLGGIVAPASVGSLKAGIRGTRAALEPLTETGQQNIVGRALNRLSSNPEAAKFNLSNVEEFVPGSQPAIGSASKDYGLISLEKAMRNNGEGAPRFAELESSNNTARQNFLKAVSGDEESIKKLREQRDVKTSHLRENAFDPGQTTDVNVRPLNEFISEIEMSPAGGSRSVSAAMRVAKSAIKRGESDPARLYEARKDIAQAISGYNDSPKAVISKAAPQLMKVQAELDSAIEKAAPGYKAYMQEYRELSKPINQMEELQKLRSASETNAPDVNGMDFISQGKWSNYLDSRRQEFSKILSPKQRDVVDRITQDLDRGATINNNAIKPIGSSSINNLSTANVIGAVLGGNNPVSSVFQRTLTPLQWLYKIPEQQIQELLIDASLNPLLAKTLMGRPTSKNVELLSKSLKAKASAAGYGISTSSLQQKDTESQRNK